MRHHKKLRRNLRNLKFYNPTFFLAIAFLVAVLQGCATSKKTNTSDANSSGSSHLEPKVSGMVIDKPDINLVTQDAKSSTAIVGQLTTSGAIPEVATENVKTQTSLPKIRVMLSPGAGFGFFHAGVLLKLSELQVKPGAIYGLEFGALVAALFAARANDDDFQWQIFRLKEEWFSENHGAWNLLMKKPGHGEALDQWLKKTFGDRRLNDLNPPLIVGAESTQTKKLEWISEGLVSDALSKALRIPGRLEPKDQMASAYWVDRIPPALEGESVWWILSNCLYPMVKGAGDEDYDKLTEGANRWFQLQAGDKILLLNPKERKGEPFEFKTRPEWIVAGKTSVEEAEPKLAEIRNSKAVNSSRGAQ